MALILSAATGNFNAGATWVGGIVPTTGDEARASTGHTVTITATVTCDEISNAGTGKFVLNSGVTLTANVTHKSTTTSINCLEFSAASPAIASIVGNITSGTVTSSIAVVNSGTGTLNITGNCLGGTGTNASAVNNSSVGIINITGNCEAGGGAGTEGSHAARNASTGSISITGNCKGAPGIGTGSGASNNSTGTLSVIGTIQATQNTAGVAGTNTQQVTILSGPFLTETARGVAPVYCRAWRWNASPSNSTYMEVMTNNLLAKRSLYTADNITGMPAASDVKIGITYGPASELTGTFEQTVSPSIEGISAGVWNYALSAITASSTIGTLLKTNIDATISSRSTLTAANVRTELTPELTEITEVHAIHGLDIANALTVTPTLRAAGAITQAITGDGTTSTIVTRV